MKDIHALLAQMTLEEKVGQLIQISPSSLGVFAEITGPAQEWGMTLEEISRVGSCLGATQAKHTIPLQRKHMADDRNHIPLLFMYDVIHGFRTIYPIGPAMAGSFDPALLYACAEMAAREAATAGIHVTFSPMVDLARDPRWGRVMETCGEDPYLASVMGAVQVKAFQGEDISAHDHLASCVKHFAAYGGAEAGRDYNPVEVSERTLRQFYLPAYKACVDAGVRVLMPSFNDLNGVPSTANTFLMKQILEQEWGYRGVTVSDWGAIAELCQQGVAEDLKEAAYKAFTAGCQIEMMTPSYYRHLVELVREGSIPESAIDEAVLRILKLKDDLGLFEDPFHGADEAKGEAMFLCPEHRALARRAANETAVLLKNDGVLPFSKDVKKIALIGPFAEEQKIFGTWNARGKAEDTVSVREGIERKLPGAEILCAYGCGNHYTDTDTSGIAEAVELAKQADAVLLCIGEPQSYTGEGKSRTDITLPGPQAELVKAVTAANPNTAIVHFSGRPLVLTNIYDSSRAILHMWMAGTEGGNAVADLVFGDVNPSGKLSMTFPRAVGQCPLNYNYTNTGRPKTVPDDQFQNYVSSYLDCGNRPLFYFGEGLSYTTFTYESMTLDTHEMTEDGCVTVTVRVKNTGERAGKEAVQLYLRDMVASAVRPVQELIAFEKIELAPGESKEVSFRITEPQLRFWNAQNQFVSEAGEFRLMVGYADHFHFTDSFRLIK